MLTVIERARKYVAKCPAAISGQNGHGATFHVAAVLVHGFALGEADALALLREWNGSCVPPWGESDLQYKIKSAANTVHTLPRGHLLDNELKNGSSIPAKPLPPPPPKPKFQKTVLARIANKVADIMDVTGFLAKRSPVPVVGQDSASVLRHLYARGSGEKILIFTDMKSQGQFLWEADRSDDIQQRHLPAGDDGVWFLPQPVSGEFLPNPRLDGKLSRRSEEAITAWRWRSRFQWKPSCANICRNSGAGVSRNVTQTHLPTTSARLNKPGLAFFKSSKTFGVGKVRFFFRASVSIGKRESFLSVPDAPTGATALAAAGAAGSETRLAVSARSPFINFLVVFIIFFFPN